MALLSGAEVYDLMPSYARMVWWRLLPNTGQIRFARRHESAQMAPGG